MQSETISVNFGASPARAQAPLFSADTYNSTDPFDLPCMDLPPMGTSGVYSSLIQDSSISAAWGTGSSGYHMSMKINNATPANLPHGLAQNLLGLHSVSTRIPGCSLGSPHPALHSKVSLLNCCM